jgi:hypothetical protein
MADYLIYHSDSTGYVFGAWSRTASDNAATFIADTKITVDGVDVVIGIDQSDRTDLACVVLTDPTSVDVNSPSGTHEVDVAGAPTDCDERTDYEYGA